MRIESCIMYYYVPSAWAVVLGMYPTFRHSMWGFQSEGEGGGGERCAMW